jgi:hypothetical protein
MDCQLENLPGAGHPPGIAQRLRRRAVRAAGLAARTFRRGAADPRLVLEKLHFVQRRPRAPLGPGVVPAPLGLRAGERVRVKPLEEIRETLDEIGDCERLGFMPVQAQFCKGEFTVRKRIDRFFDERTRRMMRIRNTVLLDGVFCEPPAGGPEDYAGCDRTCLLFWKEAWLERLQ